MFVIAGTVLILTRYDAGIMSRSAQAFVEPLPVDASVVGAAGLLSIVLVVVPSIVALTSIPALVLYGTDGAVAAIAALGLATGIALWVILIRQLLLLVIARFPVLGRYLEWALTRLVLITVVACMLVLLSVEDARLFAAQYTAHQPTAIYILNETLSSAELDYHALGVVAGIILSTAIIGLLLTPTRLIADDHARWRRHRKDIPDQSRLANVLSRWSTQLYVPLIAHVRGDRYVRRAARTGLMIVVALCSAGAIAMTIPSISTAPWFRESVALLGLGSVVASAAFVRRSLLQSETPRGAWLVEVAPVEKEDLLAQCDSMGLAALCVTAGAEWLILIGIGESGVQATAVVLLGVCAARLVLRLVSPGLPFGATAADTNSIRLPSVLLTGGIVAFSRAVRLGPLATLCLGGIALYLWYRRPVRVVDSVVTIAGSAK